MGPYRQANLPDVNEQLLEGYQTADKHFRVHLDGYNQLLYLSGEVDESPRHEFFYYGERDLYAIRYNNWKVHFQTKDDWFAGALVQPTVPRPVNLRVDPFEQHMDAPSCPVYAGEKLWTVMPAAAIVQEHVATFEDFPPRQAPPGSTRRAWSRPTYPARQAAVRVQRSYDAGRDNQRAIRNTSRDRHSASGH